MSERASPTPPQGSGEAIKALIAKHRGPDLTREEIDAGGHAWSDGYSAGLEAALTAALTAAPAQSAAGAEAFCWMVTRDSESARPEIFPTEESANANACLGLATTHVTPLYARPAPPAVPEGMVMVPREPTEEMWGELARDIVFWMDTLPHGKPTPRSMFEFFKRVGRELPDWLRDDPNMQHLDHSLSKGTRAVFIYRAMLSAAPRAKEGA